MKCVHPSILQYMTGFLKDTVIWEYHNCWRKHRGRSIWSTEDESSSPCFIRCLLRSVKGGCTWPTPLFWMALNTSIYSRVELLYVHISAELVIYFRIKRGQHFCPPCLVVKKIYAQYMPKLPNTQLLSQSITSVSNKKRKREENRQ